MNFNKNKMVLEKAVERGSTVAEDLPNQEEPTILDVLRRRWSPKMFSSRPVEPEKLRSILEAARWAPSSRNEQPWSFVVATKKNVETYNRLLSCLNEKNRQWARYAPVLILSVAKMYRDIDAKENRYAFHDVGLSTTNLIVQATALGLYTHVMAGFSVERAQELLGIPEGYEPVAVIALGYVPQSLGSKRLRADAVPKIRTRKPLDEFVFEGHWGNPAHILDNRGVQGALQEAFND
jgi:nitroreductase